MKGQGKTEKSPGEAGSVVVAHHPVVRAPILQSSKTPRFQDLERSEPAQASSSKRGGPSARREGRVCLGAVPSCVLGILMACPGEVILESLKMEETVCQAWQRTGKVAIISRQKRGRCPQRARLKVTVSKDTPRMLRIVRYEVKL